MQKSVIPLKWDLKANRRYKLQNMERAMKGKIERGLVELITNSDDSYRDLEEKVNQISGKIRIELKRKKGQSSYVMVKDRAMGMNRKEMYQKLGTLGERTSGFEKRKIRRGLNGRGAKDVAAFGIVHFESLKNEEYNHLIIPLSLECYFTEPHPQKSTKEIRKKLGIPKGNGTVVTIEVNNRFKIPTHETFVKDFSRYYSLRDIFSNPSREVQIKDMNKNREDRIIYNYTKGKTIYDKEFKIPEYPDSKAHLIIERHFTPFEQGNLPYKEGGILIKSKAAIHDCTYFGFESEPFAWRFSGELYCEFIDELICDYDDREEINPNNPNHPKNNPRRILDPFRDGLILEHPFMQILYKKCRNILQPFIEKLKALEESHKRDVTNENLDKKLNNLSKEVSKIFEKKLKELEENIPPGSFDIGIIEKLPIGIHVIPSNEEYPIPIIANQAKTFSIIVKHYEDLDEFLPINIETSDPEDVKILESPVYLKRLSEDFKIGRTTFALESSKIGKDTLIGVRYSGYEKYFYVKIIEPPSMVEIPEGFSFEKQIYYLRINKDKTLILNLKTPKKVGNRLTAEIISNHPNIVVKGGGNCVLKKNDATGVLRGKVRIQGRQLNAKAEIIARLRAFTPTTTSVIVKEHIPSSGINFTFKLVEDNFGFVRYKWENPYMLKIGAEHPSIRKYLGDLTEEEKYPGINNPIYHALIAEVIAEALAFNILEKNFKKEGQDGMLDYTSTDLYYHREFSEFLKISHKHLVN